MAIKVTVTGARQAAFVMGRLAVEVRKGARGISQKTTVQVAALVMEHDARHFRTMQRLQENRVTLPTAVFSRVKNYIGGRNSTIRIIEAKVDNLLPLADTGRLYDSVSNVHSPDVRIKVTFDAIAIVNLVPYFLKHVKGRELINTSIYDMYQFGALEQRRLLERVPPPPKQKNGKVVATGEKVKQPKDRIVISFRERGVFGRRGRVLFRDEEVGDLKTSRPYYRLKNWAEKRYPTIAKNPKRNFIYALPPEIVQVIARVVQLDVIERTQ